MGGNVQIGNYNADRIYINNRQELTEELNKLFTAINTAYEQTYKEPLWTPLLLSSKEFLSGSSFHLFDINNVPSDELLSIGDVDTQVDSKKLSNLKTFLTDRSNQILDGFKLIGFVDRGNQLISLWNFNAQNLQVDFELVDYENEFPTEWAKFSHSSEWIDKKDGIKGVFHKYLMRAFTVGSLKERYIQMKKGVKKVTSTDLAFSVDYGIREKYIDLHQTIDGIPVYQEIPVKESVYVNTIDSMFEKLFNKLPDSEERELFKSFKGGLQLANKFLNNEQKTALIEGFKNTLYGPGAQELYRDDPERDKSEKELALTTMISTLDNVKKSPREGIQHLEKMKDVEFINFCQELNGSLDSVTLTFKPDGFCAKVGRDSSGRIFFESSASGPIFVPGSFTKFAVENNKDLVRAKHYDSVFDIITTAPFVHEIPNNVKVFVEVLYNPMANGSKFVTVTYDPAKLGTIMTIVPFYAKLSDTGECYVNSEELKDRLLTYSTDEVKIVDDRLYFNHIDVSNIINPVLNLSVEVLKSRKNADKEEKNRLKEIINTVKSDLANFILTTPEIQGKDRLGDEIEGVIIHRKDHSPIKITTSEFKKMFSNKPKTVGVCFGRWNPPHKGHKIAWETAAKFDTFYIGTNPSTQGLKDPLSFNAKLECMKTIWPTVEGHVVQEKTIFTLATTIYKLHGSVNLKICTDEAWLVENLSKYNNKESSHGYYNFSSIEQVVTERPTSATTLRTAVHNNDKDKFSEEAGISWDTPINLDGVEMNYFDAVKNFLQEFSKEKVKDTQ